MQSFSGVAASPAPDASGVKQRIHYRHPIHSLIYVILDEGNGGIIRNLSQNGAAVQAVGALRPGQEIRMRFDLLKPKSRFDVRAVVSWANPSGQAGVCFTDVSRQTCRQLNEWIFANLMRGLEQTSPAYPVPGEQDDLILSTYARPAIRVGLRAPSAPAPGKTEDVISLAWWPVPIRPTALAKFMDGLILFSAILMFFCAFLATAREIPAWPLTALVGVGVCGLFTSLYWCLGSWLGCGTLGAQLAKTAVRGRNMPMCERRARFR